MASFQEVFGSRGGDWIGADNEFVAPDGAYTEFFGDVTQTLSGDAQGGNDTLVGGNGGFLKFFWGDARGMLGNSVGGDDYIEGGSSIWENRIYGDAENLYGSAVGGNDTIIGGTGTNFNTIYGDGFTLAENAIGGDDYIFGGEDTNYTQLYGDAAYLSGSSIGGNDTIVGGSTTTSFGASVLFGDGQELRDAAVGGDDILISGNDNDGMWGDGYLSGAEATGGQDTFVFLADNGQDTINDFRQSEDMIDLSAFDFLVGLPGRIPVDKISSIGLANLLEFVPGADWALDTNGDGTLNEPDEFISTSGTDTIIDLGAATGGTPGEDIITVLNVTGLLIDDFIL